VIRQYFSEPYPGFFMPAFSGTGLEMSSPTTGSIILPRLEVTFTDGNTVQIPRAILFGDAPAELRAGMLFNLLSDFNGTREEGRGGKICQWYGPTFFTFNESSNQDDYRKEARQYVFQRLKKLYPTRTPVSITIETYLTTLFLDDPYHVAGHVINKSTFPLQ